MLAALGAMETAPDSQTREPLRQMRPNQFVETARNAAVATDVGDRILACNAKFRELVGWSQDRDVTSRRLHELLEIADVSGNRRSPNALPIWESLLAGERIRPFEMQLRTGEDRRQLVSTSLVVFVGAASDDCALVYLVEPLVQRERATQAMDRLLRHFERDAGNVRPPWWSDQSGDSPLTRRQVEVVRHLAAGMSAQDLARALGVSPHTARSHIQSIYERLGVHSRGEVVAWAYRHDLI